MAPEVLPRGFYERDSEVVARELLGKKLVRRLGDETMEGILVETEAYYGLQDPASRAYHGKKNYNSVMWGEVGRAFVYNVHKYWLFNIVAHEGGKIGAVLIRAIEPTEGMETMRRNRQVDDVRELTNGPGRLTRALKIDKTLNGVPVTNDRSEIHMLDNEAEFQVGTSHRIGVTKDLPQELRFYMKGNRFVSK